MQVDKQCAQFFGVTIDEEQARLGIVVRVTSSAQSKFKVAFAECRYLMICTELSVQF